MYISIPVLVMMFVILSMVCGCRNKPRRESASRMKARLQDQRARDKIKDARLEELRAEDRITKAAYKAKLIAQYGSWEEYEAYQERQRVLCIGLHVH